MAKSDWQADRDKCKQIVDGLIDPQYARLSNREYAKKIGVTESYVRRAKAMFPYGPTALLKIADLKLDPDAQPRVKIDEDVVKSYMQEIKSGALFPPIGVLYDGVNHWVWDGWHRILAHQRLGREEIEADVEMGVRRDAVLMSVGANATHGLRRSNEDKRRAVTILLKDEEWGQWSDREIGKRCGVDHKTVAKIRSEIATGEIPQSQCVQSPRKTNRNGAIVEVNTADINAGRSESRSQRSSGSAPSNPSHNGIPALSSSPIAVATEEPPDPVSEPADESQETSEEALEASPEPESVATPVVPSLSPATKLCPCCNGTGRIPIDFEEAVRS